MKWAGWFMAGCLAGAGLQAGEWPEWRGGPARDGVWNEKLPRTLPEEGPPLVWKARVGTGYSGPSVAEGRVFLLDRLLPPETPEEVERVVCLDAHSGKTLWVYAYPCRLQLRSGYANGPRSTPTYHRGKVYTLGAMGHLHCLEAATGRLLWSHSLQELAGARIPDWGVANSPLVIQDRLLVQAGGEGAALMAFDPATGRELWRGLTNKAGYASLIPAGGGREAPVIAWTADCVYAIAPGEGRVLGQMERKLAWDQAVATPLYHASKRLVLVSSDREGTLAMRLPGRSGRLETVWDSDSFSALHGSSVLVGDLLFGLHHNGNAREECGELRCVEAPSGRLLWKTNGVTRTGIWAQASVTYNRGNRTFYILNESGELILAEANASGYRERSRAAVLGKTWSHPAYAYGRIYARSETTLVCADLKQRPGSGSARHTE